MPSLLACLGCGGKGESDDVRTLDYCHASLNDVPSDVFACERTLEELYLDSNQLSELPRQLFYCHGLRTLGLSDNELTSLPPAVASLINLNSIDLSKNAISDIPDNIKGCKQLSSVDASINPLCRLPEGFTQLLSLQELYLNDTFLEYLPANFGRLSRLRILELRENQLNTLPKSIARLTTLQRLDIGQNDFSELPEVIGSLVNLTELWFDNNKVKSVPPLVGRLRKLTHLDACKNKVDWVAGEVENCTSLTDLHLSSNNLKELPEQLGSCRALETLKVDDNALTCLPATLGGLISLQELVASQNDLEELPASVGLLRALHTLHLDDNLLTDLPGELGSCCNLRVLTAASNRLTSVPGELGHLPCLAVLNLCDNLLPHLPVSLTKLKLRALWLSENQNKAKVQLQSETHPGTGQRVLTCFMLPQQPRPHHPEAVEEDTFPGPGWEEQRRARTLIKFAFEADVDKPGGRLSRAPTPYPKELKALARHARNLSALQKDPQRQFVPGALQKDPARQFVPARGLTEHGTQGKVSQASVTSSATREGTDDPDKVPQNSRPGEEEPGEGQVITSPLPVLAPQAEERPLLREARNVRNSSALNGQAGEASKSMSGLDAGKQQGGERPYAIGDRKVFGLAQVVSTARTPGEEETPHPETIPLLPRATPQDTLDQVKDHPLLYNMIVEHDREPRDRAGQDDDEKQEDSTLTVKEIPGPQQTVAATTTTPTAAATTTEDENNDTSSSSDSGYGNGKTSQQQSVDEPQCSEGGSTTPSSPIHLTTDPTLSLPSTPSSPPAPITLASPVPTSAAPSTPTYAPSSMGGSPAISMASFMAPGRPLSLAPQQRLGLIAAPTSARPASIATGGQVEMSGTDKVARPGSLALGALADSALLTRVPQEQRPGSLAAPINTVGIPPAPTRAASHMALNTTTTPTRLHQHPMFRSQDLSRAGRGWGQDTRPVYTTPRKESNGLVSIIDQVTSLLEHDDSPPPKTATTEVGLESQQTGPQYTSGQGRTEDREPGGLNSSGGPANFTQDQPRGEVLHPTPHRPAGPRPHHHEGIEGTPTSKPTQSDTPSQKVSKLPSRIPSCSPDSVPPLRLNHYHPHSSQSPHPQQDCRIPTPGSGGHVPGEAQASLTPRTPVPAALTPDPRRTSDTRIPTFTNVSHGPGSLTSDPRAPWETQRPMGHSDLGSPSIGESNIPTPGRSLSNLSQESLTRKLSPATPTDTRPQRPGIAGGRISQIPRSPATPTPQQIPVTPTPPGPVTPTASQGPARQQGGYGFSGRPHILGEPGQTSRLQSPGYTGIRLPSFTSPSQSHPLTPSHAHPHTPQSHQHSYTPTHPHPRPSYTGIRTPGVVNSAINTPGIPLPTSQPSLSSQLTSPGSRASVTSTGSASRIPHMAGGVPSRLPGPASNWHRVTPASGQPQTVSPGPQTPDSGRSGWMFGQHKNARVFPVVIEKNPDLGFTIGQSSSDPDDKSVYVASVAGGGAASSALKVGDKLLQVDGADLRSASLPTAAAALANTTATVNLMVSRLQ